MPGNHLVLLAVALPSIARQASDISRVATTSATANPTLWYITRAAAVSAYIALACTVLLGIARSMARAMRVSDTWLLEQVHRYVANATVAFVAVHVTALALDPLIPFAPVSLLVPINEPYRPFAVALGILSLYLLVIVIASSWLRRHLPHTLWRMLHYGSFALFWLVTLHGLLAGTDASQPWMQLVYAGAALAVAGGMLLRAFGPTASVGTIRQAR